MDSGDVFRRAGGRRRINSQRRQAAEERRAAVLQLIDELWAQGIPESQHKAAIAARLGLSLRSVQRHYRQLKTGAGQAAEHRCPLCGASVRLERVVGSPHR